MLANALAVALTLPLRAVPPTPPPPEALTFREFFVPSPRGLQPSPRFLGLEGKRVRLTGYMAQMEAPPAGGFFLCAVPVFATEAGGGTADLPPDAVLVLVPKADKRPLKQVLGPLEVIGTLEIGSRADAEGRVSRIRIRLEPDSTAAAAVLGSRPQTSRP